MRLKTMNEIDDETVAYVLENRKSFEDLRQVAAQLAGLLVLAAAGAKSGTADHPMLEAAGELYQEAVEGVRRARATSRARRHHHHVVHAAAAIGRALSTARDHPGRLGSARELDRILTPLRAGYTHLQRAADALPGFELIAFEQGCCAHYAHTPQDEVRTER